MFTVEREFHGRKISFEVGKVAKQANGSVIVRSGDAVVMVTVCMAGDREVDFFPLSIEYVEKTYAAGKIPGGYFKREGKLSEKEVLTSRVIDRPCRPLFPENFMREVQVIATVLSADQSFDPDILAICGASAALSVSDIPFMGPMAGVRVARLKGKLLINPTLDQIAKAELSFMLAGTKDAIVMVEGGAKEIPEAEVLEALFHAHKELQTIIQMQEELVSKVGKPKIEWKPAEYDKTLYAQMAEKAKPRLAEAMRTKDKMERRNSLQTTKEALSQEFVKAEGITDADARKKLLSKVFEDVSYEVVRRMAFDESRRVDGRDFTTVRPIDIEVGYLPSTHGSSLFTRGETQAIVTTTLGVEQEAQYLDPLVGDENRKYFMLHYNFPPFSVGEVKMLRGTNRREMGHGALAERALKQILPEKDTFPYVVRIVSEITESNGSSSMASVCGGCLALMDAGVPVKAAVAGVAMGLMKEGEKFVVLTDILGDEDHLGDMDFKVCGSATGITALQMDIKIAGLTQEIMTKAMEQAKVGRLHILEKMAQVLSAPRTAMRENAPRIEVFKISSERIKDIIGPGGKTIRSIVEAHNVKIDVSDDGRVTVSGNNRMQLEGAVALCKSLTAEAEIGKVYKGVVKRIADFGAFVEILPGIDGLVHISQLTEDKVRRVTDVLQEGDETFVKVLEIDRQGKIRLSRKDALQDLAQSA